MRVEDCIREILGYDLPLAQVLFAYPKMSHAYLQRIKNGSQVVEIKRFHKACLYAKCILKSVNDSVPLGIRIENDKVVIMESIVLSNYLNETEKRLLFLRLQELLGACIMYYTREEIHFELRHAKPDATLREIKDLTEETIGLAYERFWRRLPDFNESTDQEYSITTFLRGICMSSQKESIYQRRNREFAEIINRLEIEGRPVTVSEIAKYYNTEAGANGTGYYMKASEKLVENYLFHYKRMKDVSLEQILWEEEEGASKYMKSLSEEQHFTFEEEFDASEEYREELKVTLYNEAKKYTLAELIVEISRLYRSYGEDLNLHSKEIVSDEVVVNDPVIREILISDIRTGRYLNGELTEEDMNVLRNKLYPKFSASIHNVTKFGNAYGRGTKKLVAENRCKRKDLEKFAKDILYLLEAFQKIIDETDAEIERRRKTVIRQI